MTIYIDVLFVVNMFINYFLLLISSKIAKTSSNRGRILFSSVLGGLYCVFSFMSKLSVFEDIFFKVLITLLMSLIAFKFLSFSHFLRCSTVFLTVGFLFGGIVYGVYFLTKPTIMNVKNSAIYLHISPVLLITCSATTYILVLIFSYFLKPQQIPSNNTYCVTITYRENSIYAQGFVDTGNKLTDIFTDYPVILCDIEIIKSLLTVEELQYFKSNLCEDASLLPKAFRLIPVSTVAGSTLLPAFKPDDVVLYTHNESYSVNSVIIAVFNKKNYNSQHEIILNPELIINKNQGGSKDVFRNSSVN